jgi:hypothetical protein
MYLCFYPGRNQKQKLKALEAAVEHSSGKPVSSLLANSGIFGSADQTPDDQLWSVSVNDNFQSSFPQLGLVSPPPTDIPKDKVIHQTLNLFIFLDSVPPYG